MEFWIICVPGLYFFTLEKEADREKDKSKVKKKNISCLKVWFLCTSILVSRKGSYYYYYSLHTVHATVCIKFTFLHCSMLV